MRLLLVPVRLTYRCTFAIYGSHQSSSFHASMLSNISQRSRCNHGESPPPPPLMLLSGIKQPRGGAP